MTSQAARPVGGPSQARRGACPVRSRARAPAGIDPGQHDHRHRIVRDPGTDPRQHWRRHRNRTGYSTIRPPPRIRTAYVITSPPHRHTSRYEAGTAPSPISSQDRRRTVMPSTRIRTGPATTPLPHHHRQRHGSAPGSAPDAARSAAPERDHDQHNHVREHGCEREAIWHARDTSATKPPDVPKLDISRFRYPRSYPRCNPIRPGRERWTKRQCC